MRRTKTLGLCLIAVFALAAAAAANASAETTPTWYECAKAAKVGKTYTGKFTNKTCTEASAESKGEYELKEGIGKAKEFKGKGGVAVLHIKTFAGDDTVTCQSSKETGKLELPNRESNVVVKFSKCKALETKVCTSAGAKAGEIALPPMKGELGYVEENVVGLKLESEAHPGYTGLIVAFSCEDLEATVTGGLIGTVGKDVNVIDKESETVDLATESIGLHEFHGLKYKPTVNPLGWFDEQAEIAKELEEDLEGKLAKLERPILKTLICGEYIKKLLGIECTPEAYAGQDQTTVIKGEALMIKA